MNNTNALDTLEIQQVAQTLRNAAECQLTPHRVLWGRYFLCVFPPAGRCHATRYFPLWSFSQGDKRCITSNLSLQATSDLCIL